VLEAVADAAAAPPLPPGASAASPIMDRLENSLNEWSKREKWVDRWRRVKSLDNVADVTHKIRPSPPKFQPKDHIYPPERGADPDPKTWMNWTQHQKDVTAAGHPWCTLLRDNWACWGERYITRLKGVPPLRPETMMASLPRGTRIFADGNSHFSQLFFNVACHSAAEVSLSLERSNSIMAYHKGQDVGLVMFGNDGYWNMKMDKEIEWLKQEYKPSHLLFSVQNTADEYHLGGPDHLRNRVLNFSKAFPEAKVFTAMWANAQPRDCAADFKDCHEHGNHQCVPGPAINKHTQNVVDAIRSQPWVAPGDTTLQTFDSVWKKGVSPVLPTWAPVCFAGCGNDKQGAKPYTTGLRSTGRPDTPAGQ